MRESAYDMEQLVGGSCDHLFMLLCEDIARDLGMHRPVSLGSLEHEAEVRDRALRHLQELKKGQKVKISRWFSFFDVAAELEKKWHLVLWLLVFVGIQNKWFSNVMASPLGDRFQRNSGGQNGAATSSAPSEQAFSVNATGQAPPTVRHSDMLVEEMRRSAKNQLHLAASILGRRKTRDNMVMLLAIAAPSREAFGKMIVCQKTRRGGAEWGVLMARGTSWGTQGGVSDLGPADPGLVRSGLLTRVPAVAGVSSHSRPPTQYSE